MSRLKFTLIFISTFVLVSLLALFTLLRIYGRPFHVPSTTMEPTIVAGDRILAQQKYDLSTPPKRGDIIVFRYPENKQVKYIKRVVALGGDRLRIAENQIIVNDIPIPQQPWDHDRSVLAEMTDSPDDKVLMRESQVDQFYFVVKSSGSTFVYGNWPKDVDEILVPNNHAFVMGDNRDNSIDSRVYGSIPHEDIVATVQHVFYSYGPEGLRGSRFFKSL